MGMVSGFISTTMGTETEPDTDLSTVYLVKRKPLTAVLLWYFRHFGYDIRSIPADIY